MDNLTSVLMQSLGQGGLDMMAQKAGVQSNQAASALEGIIPSILGGMAKNTREETGAGSLLNALDSDHDGSVLDDVAGFMGGGQADGMGAGILKHVLGGNRSSVENGIGQKTGMSASQIGSLMNMVAPLIMGYLGKQRKQNPNTMSNSGIGSMLEGLTGAADNGTGLDLGDVLDLVGAFSGNKSNSSGGGLLGGLLGKVLKG
ncbi:MAG: DUF937 domain-containing protein [Bacteroidota bacterium]